MKLFRTSEGPVLQRDDQFIKLEMSWDTVFQATRVVDCLRKAEGIKLSDEAVSTPLAPMASQELWAAGVTYYSSRLAREEESEDGSSAACYRKIYEAKRPELFFKANGWRVQGPDQPIRIRRDSSWNVPEPELALAISSSGEIFGYTVGNDVSSRTIEGENPLYLPQAKIYDGSAALGPCIFVTEQSLPPETAIHLTIKRNAALVFSGETHLGQIKRELKDLRDYLLSELSFPHGVLLMTGTGIIPPNEITLQSGDEVTINIEPIGSLRNTVS